MISVKSHFTTEVFYVEKMDDVFVCTYFIPDSEQVKKDPENTNMVFKMEWLNKATGDLEAVSDEKILTEMGEYIFSYYTRLFHLPQVSLWARIKYWWKRNVLKKENKDETIG